MYRASSVSQIFCSLEILLAIKYFYVTLEWTFFCSFSFLILMLHMKGSDYSLISEEGTSGSDHSSYESGSWVECLTLYPQSCSAYNLLQYCFFVVAHL